MRVVSSAFLEFQDYTNQTLNDIVVAPFDVTWDLKAKITDREDGSQEFNAEFVKTKFKFKKCEMVFNALVPGTEDALSDPDEDFDEDEAETEREAAAFKAELGIAEDARRLRTTNYQNLACGAKGMIP